MNIPGRGQEFPRQFGKSTFWIGLLVLLFSSFPLLDLLGFLGSENRWHVPRWLAWIFALIFPSTGLWLIFMSLQEMVEGHTDRFQKIANIFLGLLLFSLLGASSIFLTWQAISPFGEWQSSFSIGGVTVPMIGDLQKTVDRVVVGIAAFIIDVLCIYLLVYSIKELSTRVFR